MSDNSSDMRTYKITITREKPEVSVAASLRQSTEGGVLGYTVARSTPAPDILEVQVEVVEDGEMVPDTSQAEGNRSIVIPAGATSTTFAIETEMDDEIWEDHSNVTVTVKDSISDQSRRARRGDVDTGQRFPGIHSYFVCRPSIRN